MILFININDYCYYKYIDVLLLLTISLKKNKNI